MEPTEYERESKDTCQRLLYALNDTGQPIPRWVKLAASSSYGDVNRINEAVVMLCSTIRAMSPDDFERVVYNAHSKESRKLATWWERHEKADRKREACEAKERAEEELRQAALAKLSPEEQAVLGLDQ